MFYALGNIGDSKKSDYTRAYDPKDMNEFTIEISDNTKNNATFQSGVYLDESGRRRIETFTIGEDGEAVSVEKPQSFVYPITKEEWANESNMRRWTLYNEGFDGDHSFEARYACCGDYRDGKIVNDTTGTAKAQAVLNNDVWRAFYRWVITSTDKEFKEELDQWCVRSAVEFFYAFTHMYTMMDNRSKNTFWHFAKTGTYRKVTKPVKELLHVYCELSGENYIPTKDVEINSGKTYYTQYAFDLWDYDNDTALGISNNGELIFPYGKEDTDYTIEGDPSSGYVFNGATSVFWCRLRDLLQDEVRATFNSVAAECFSATNLIHQFDDFQSCYPEEIWRLDIQRKYIRTFTGGSIDNSKPKSDVQYLRDMMQGRKKYQRRQWMRDQEMYFGTKNLMNTVVGDNNRITFRCFTPTGSNIVVKPDYTLRITPYSDMYVSVMFGNGSTQQVRAKGGQEYTITCPLSTMDDTQVVIYGANRIQALNDLSACYIAANNFSMATKLRKLVLGNTTEGYNNAKLVSLTLGSNKLLEELDIRNCGSLTGAINLAQCNNLLKLYAEGTKLTGVIFATNGKVQVAHLPETINNLTMRNLNNLTDFQAELSKLDTLTLEGGAVDSLEIVNKCINTLRVLYLYGIDWILGETDLLNKLLNLFYSVLTGSVYVSGKIRQQEIESYAKKWSDLTVSYDSGNIVEQYLATYVNADGTELYREYVDRGGKPRDPVVLGLIETPTMESTAQYNYTYTGWDNLDYIMLSNITITAQYSTEIRSYTVTWYKRAGVSLGSQTVEYGQEAVYDGIPTYTDDESVYMYNLFKQWDKSTGFVTEDMDVYAVWNKTSLPVEGTELKDMSIAEIYAVCQAGKADDYFVDKDYFEFKMGQDFEFSNVESRLLVENKFFDGRTYIDTDIKLFAADSPSFTLAIDYEFLKSNESDNSLVSAFVEDGTEGFRLRYGSAPSVQWGDKNAVVGTGGNRGMVVLRHVKDSNVLRVYGIDTDETAYSAEVGSASLTRTRSTNINQVLTFGAVGFEDGGHDLFATGWIHWCKIWFDDLGDTVAKKIASWSRETQRMEFAGSNRYRLSGASKRANGSFFANSALPKLARMNSNNTNVGGWDASEMRTETLNKRIYNGLPYELQSALKQVKIYASQGGQSTTVLLSDDYLYLAANREVGGWTSEPYNSEGTAISYFTTDISRIKFAGCIIKENAKYFNINTDPSADASNGVVDGDIWIKSSNGYMYVSADTASKHSRIGGRDITASDNITAADGGVWVKSCSWWQRSPYVESSNYFIAVYTHGNPYYNYMGAYNNMGVVYGFSI